MSLSEINQPSTPNTPNRFDFSIFHSDVLFTINLAPTECSWQPELEIVPNRPFYVHRSMLASMSPEMAKHVDNAMKEGHEKAMTLHDVDYATMQRVVQWGYAKRYETEMEGPPSLFLHTRIYCFASRFNITALQDLSYEGALADLKSIGKPKTTLEFREAKDFREDVRPMMIQILGYAFENLPTGQGHTAGRLLLLLTSYVAWGLMAFREDSDFRLLLSRSPDLAIAVMDALDPHRYPLWELQDNTHALSRICLKCRYVGIAKVKCPHVHPAAAWPGLQVFLHGSRESWKYATGCCGETWRSYQDSLICPACHSKDLRFVDKALSR
ncbi:hypothetical protein BDZ91DRAFT_430219 [Kalaharituber pfeilii]|nr:hypothetical protein BDZ91DRAFT_430219 [Kalaharituber pfeilii]